MPKVKDDGFTAVMERAPAQPASTPVAPRTTSIGEIRARNAEDAERAKVSYAGLVGQVARGERIEEWIVDDVIRTAGKSLDDLEADASRVQQRTQWRETLEGRDGAQRLGTEVYERIVALGVEKKAEVLRLEKDYDRRILDLRREHDVHTSAVQRADEAAVHLRNSTLHPELLERESRLQRRRLDLLGDLAKGTGDDLQAITSQVPARFQEEFRRRVNAAVEETGTDEFDSDFTRASQKSSSDLARIVNDLRHRRGTRVAMLNEQADIEREIADIGARLLEV